MTHNDAAASEEPAQNSDCSNAADALLEIYVSAGSPAHVDGIGWADTVAFETDCKAAMYPTMVEAEKCKRASCLSKLSPVSSLRSTLTVF